MMHLTAAQRRTRPQFALVHEPISGTRGQRGVSGGGSAEEGHKRRCIRGGTGITRRRMVLGGDVLLLTALALGGLMLGRDGASMGAPLHVAPGHGTQQHNTAGALLTRALQPLRSLRDILPDDASVCVSETEERLLCTERSRFNLNTFGLRFGKRQGGSRRSRVRRRAGSSHLPVPAYGPKRLPT